MNHDSHIAPLVVIISLMLSYLSELVGNLKTEHLAKMSRPPPHRQRHRHPKTPQEEIMTKMSEEQPQRSPNLERPHRHDLPRINEDDGNDNIPDLTRIRQSRHHHHIQKAKTLNNDNYEDSHVQGEPAPFHERFEQDHNEPSPTSSRLDNRASNYNRGRSRSVPVSLDGRGRLGANFRFPTNLSNERETSPGRFPRANVEYQNDDDVSPENHHQHRESYPDRLAERRHSGSVRHSPVKNREDESFNDEQSQDFHGERYPSEQFIGESYNGKNSKKVSYASDSTRMNGMQGYSQEEHQTGKGGCRLRADDSDCNIGPCLSLRHQRLSSPDRNSPIPQIPPPFLQVNSVDSQNSFTRPTAQKDVDGFFTKSNNNNSSSSGALHSSQDSMLSVGRPLHDVYSKEVLPLQIEIPENVADFQAFRRYLSVRRGALTSDRNSFEKRCQTSPSYESLGGRRPGRAPMGMTPSRVQLGHEASRRTASLSHAIMTLALLSASICQLRFIITYSHSHSYPVLNYFLIFTSIILEIAAGIGYVMISRCSYDDEQTEAINNYLIFALFIVAISNVILAAFAFDGHICEDLKKEVKSFPSNAPLVPQQINHVGAVENQGMNLRYNALE